MGWNIFWMENSCFQAHEFSKYLSSNGAPFQRIVNFKSSLIVTIIHNCYNHLLRYPSICYWIFGDLFNKKWPMLVILVPLMIRQSGSYFFLRKLAFIGCWGQFLMHKKSLLRTSESSRFLNSIIWGLYFDVLKKKIFW